MINSSYFCRTCFFTISECSYCTVVCRFCGNNGLTSFPPAKNSYCTVLRTRLIISRHVCTWPSPIPKELGFRFWIKVELQKSFLNPRTYLANKITVHTLLVRKTLYSRILYAFHGISPSAPLLPGLYFVNTWQLDLNLPHSGSLYPSTHLSLKPSMASLRKRCLYLPKDPFILSQPDVFSFSLYLSPSCTPRTKTLS